MLRLPPTLATEVQTLGARYGAPALIEAHLPDRRFDPLVMTDRVGEVCMVIRRSGGHLLTMRKTVYPAGVFRLPTGGIGHGESIEAALLREVAEETSLEVAVRRFLAVIAYASPQGPSGTHSFYTFAFLLDELGGTLAAQDPTEDLEAYGSVAPDALPHLADELAALEARNDRAISGNWRNWGLFRAVVHRVVAECLDHERRAGLGEQHEREAAKPTNGTNAN